MPKIEYSTQSARLSEHKLFTSCIRRGLVSSNSIVDGDWPPTTEWCQRYLPCVVTRIRCVGIIWEYVPRTDCIGQGNDFELMPMVTMETRHPIEGYFGSEFPAICNHWGFMAAWSCRTLQILENFLHFLGKTTPYGKIIKILFQTREIWRMENRWNRALPTGQKKLKNFAWLSSCRYCVNCAQNVPAPKNVLRLLQILSNHFTFGGVIAERVNTDKTRRRVKSSLALSRIITEHNIHKPSSSPPPSYFIILLLLLLTTTTISYMYNNNNNHHQYFFYSQPSFSDQVSKKWTFGICGANFFRLHAWMNYFH